MRTLIRTLSGFSFLGVLAGAIPLLAQIPIEGPVETHATISVESKQPTPLDPNTVKVEVNGHETPLTSLTRVRPGSAQVAILVDDGLRTSFGNQIDDVKKFIMSLPPGVQVLVGYMRNGTVVSELGFSADRESVAGTVRMPIASPGISASPYFCLSDFVKKWPSNAPGSRFVLLLTNGIDPYNGSTSILNQDSPYVQTAQEDAQRAGVAVYSIPYHEAGVRGGSFSGQSYLQQVAEATGGRLLYQGSISPVSLAPFLNEFKAAIAESYTASFMVSTSREKRDTLTRVKITSSQPKVKIHVPEGVHPGEQ